MKPEVVRTTNFVGDATNYILGRAREALATRGEFRIALSGGNTPRPVYAAVAKSADLPWDRFVITFGDERCVPPDDKESNFRMANEAWLTPAQVPKGSILRMAGEKDRNEAAAEYEDALQRLAQQKGETVYRHDLILLGIGDDGHTASLFPGTPALQETERLVVSNFVPRLKSWRLTFTFPLINQARHVCFLVNGKSEELIEGILHGDSEYPSARVRPEGGDVTWIVGALPMVRQSDGPNP